MRFFVLFCALLCVMAAASPAAAQTPGQAEVRRGPWRVQFTAARGVALWYDDVPVSRQSQFYIVKPGWTGILYDQRAAAPQLSVSRTPDGGQVVAATSRSEDATVGYIVTLSPDNSVTVTLAYGLTRDVPASFEYAAGYLNAALLADAPFSAATAQGPKSGTVPYATPSTEQDANMFVPSFRQLTLGTRLGSLQMTVSGDCPDFVCFDARRDAQSWARESPIFWTGLRAGAYPLRFAGGRMYHVIVRYAVDPPAPPGRTAGPEMVTPERVARPTITPTPAASVPQIAPLLIIPQPKSLRPTSARFAITPRTRLVIADDANADDRATAECVQRELHTRFGIATLPVVRAHAVTQAENVIVLGEPGRLPLAGKLLTRTAGTAPTKPEGYALRVSPRWVTVTGHDIAGTFYGVQTLCQMLGADGTGVFVRGASVDDWPSLAWRGAHLFVGAQALPFHKKLIANVFARFKLNSLVLQCEQARWDTVGPSAPAWAMSKADLKAEIAFARAHHLEPTPLVNSVGHMEWLFSDPSRLALAEDPQTPYAANPTNPATYDFLFKLYDEVLDTFHSSTLGIGGDEVTLRGRYPYRSRGVYPTVADAFLAHITKVHDHLAGRGVGTLIWGDMLLHATETQDAANAPTVADARKMRAGLPKDIVIGDWHYAATGDFSSPQTFRAAGFGKVIAATWFTPGNIAHFSQEQVIQSQLGLLQTTWAGYNSRAENLADDPKQFWAFVLAAEYAWSGTPLPPDRLPYNPAQVFRAAYAPQPEDRSVRTGFTVDLSPAANRALSDTDARGGWLGYGPPHDLSLVPTGPQRLGGVLYQIGPRLLLLRGALNPPGTVFPTAVTLPLARKAASLSFLMTSAYAALPKEETGAIRMTYADGTAARVPLVYGRSLAAWNDATDADDAPVVWRGRTRAGETVLLRALTWVNPFPQKTIAAVTLTATDATAAPALLALTGVGAAEN